MQQTTKLFRFSSIISICIALATSSVQAADDTVIAIDIALKPDATMSKLAESENKELRESYPKGFAFDATHHPHITLLQRFVHKSDLDKIATAANKVLAKDKPASFKLTALKSDFFKNQETGLACIVIKQQSDISSLQQELIDAVAPYTVETGNTSAFFTTPGDDEINPSTIKFVTHFLELATDEKFSPHVSTGIGSIAYLEKSATKPFHSFTFSPAGAAVYQLGNHGTARKELRALDIKP